MAELLYVNFGQRHIAGRNNRIRTNHTGRHNNRAGAGYFGRGKQVPVIVIATHSYRQIALREGSGINVIFKRQATIRNLDTAVYRCDIN